MNTFTNLQYFIANRIKSLRLERRLSQEKLSELAGLGTKYIFNVENRNYNIRIQTLEKIISALEITPEEFFEFDYPPENTPILNLITEMNNLPKEKQAEIINLFQEFIKVMK